MTATTEQPRTTIPRLKQRYRDDITGQLREKRFMKIISLAPEVL